MYREREAICGYLGLFLLLFHWYARRTTSTGHSIPPGQPLSLNPLSLSLSLSLSPTQPAHWLTDQSVLRRKSKQNSPHKYTSPRTLNVICPGGWSTPEVGHNKLYSFWGANFTCSEWHWSNKWWLVCWHNILYRINGPTGGGGILGWGGSSG